MTIRTLEYEDHQRHWKLEKMELGSFNLLVGVSGAGKTSVLEVLREVRNMGLSRPRARRPGGERRWCIELQTDSVHTYRWEAEVSVLDGASKLSSPDEPQELDRSDSLVRFTREQIICSKGCDDSVIVDRGPEGFLFQGTKLPRLKDTESSISLLKDEDFIAPLYRALRRIIFSYSGDPEEIILMDEALVERCQSAPPASEDELRESTDLSVFLKAYIARLHFPEVFDRIRQQYMSIFDNVADITLGWMNELDPVEAQRARWLADRVFTVAIKEHGVEDWIVAPYMSSGMLRTFFHLAELELAARGTTIVLDEYENSMGVNCLPAVTEQFLWRQDDLQFVLTSHHPYVIQNVPIAWWRVVTRRGGVVTVRAATEIPELNTRTKQDAFTLLANSSVYEEGIQ